MPCLLFLLTSHPSFCSAPEGPPSVSLSPLTLVTGLWPTLWLFFLQEKSQLIDRSKSFHSRHPGGSSFWTLSSTGPLWDQMYNIIFLLP